jgi:hypothetical protein
MTMADFTPAPPAARAGADRDVWVAAHGAWLTGHPALGVLDFPCRYCRAPAGVACHSARASSRDSGHAPRIDATNKYNDRRALAAWRAGDAAVAAGQ